MSPLAPFYRLTEIDAQGLHAIRSATVSLLTFALNIQDKVRTGSVPSAAGEHTQASALSEVSFLRKFIRHITGTLEEVVGLHEALGYINTVAQRIGEQLNEAYRQALNKKKLDRQQVCDVITDLQRRTNGSAKIIYDDEDKIVLEGCVCPFGHDVQDRPSMCIMVCNTVGVIVAQNLGYCKVSIEESRAQGDATCKVTMHLSNTAESRACYGHEHFRV